MNQRILFALFSYVTFGAEASSKINNVISRVSLLNASTALAGLPAPPLPANTQTHSHALQSLCKAEPCHQKDGMCVFWLIILCVRVNVHVAEALNSSAGCSESKKNLIHPDCEYEW